MVMTCGSGVLVENLSMSTGAQADISIPAGWVDITTESTMFKYKQSAGEGDADLRLEL
jgi:hypothetical protein